MKIFPRNWLWLAASEEKAFMCVNPKVGSTTYITTTFFHFSEMRVANRSLLANQFKGNKENMKGLKNKNSVSFVVNTGIYEGYWKRGFKLPSSTPTSNSIVQLGLGLS